MGRVLRGFTFQIELDCFTVEIKVAHRQSPEEKENVGIESLSKIDSILCFSPRNSTTSRCED